MKKRAVIIAAAIAGLLAAGALGAGAWIKHSIRHAVGQALGGVGAEVELGRVSVNLLRRAVTVRNVRVKAQNNDVAHRGFTVVALDVAFENVTARGIGYKKTDGQPALKADRLIVEGPRATLVTKDAAESHETSETPRPDSPVQNNLPASLSLTIGEISVSGATLEHVHWNSGGESTRTTLGGGKLSAHGFTLDSLPANIGFAADSIVFSPYGGTQVLRADTIALETATGMLTLGGFALVPQFDKEEFAARDKKHADWTAVTIGDIACSGVDFGRLIAAKTLAIDSVALAGIDIASYKNRKVFQQPQTKKMLYETIRDLRLPLDIGTLAFEDLDVTYEELAENGDSPGTVTLTGGSGSAKDITNIAGEGGRVMTIDIDATFMQSGALRARFLFPVGAADDNWELSGRLGATDMVALNRALEPLMNVRITSGEIHSLDFQVTGTLERSHSRLTMAYNDLQVAFLDKYDHARERRLLTFLVDDLLIRPDNPERGDLRGSEGEYTHNPERSMWNYIWHSLLSAILKTVT